MEKYELPVDYTKLNAAERKAVREQYMEAQNWLCSYCGCDLMGEPASNVLAKKINWNLFPPNFLRHFVHLQHNHVTGITEGAVHAYCNAVLWQYEGR